MTLARRKRQYKWEFLHANKKDSLLPPFPTEQVATVMILLLFHFRFGHIKIPPRASPTSHFVLLPLSSTCPPPLPLPPSLCLILCFVCAFRGEKRAQTGLRGVREGKRGGLRQLRKGFGEMMSRPVSVSQRPVGPAGLWGLSSREQQQKTILLKVVSEFTLCNTLVIIYATSVLAILEQENLLYFGEYLKSPRHDGLHFLLEPRRKLPLKKKV